MAFTSTSFFYFAAFFFVVFPLLGPRLRVPFVTAFSLLFYGWWDVRYVPLILLSGAIDYLCAIRIHDSARPAARKRWMAASVVLNLAILIYFKYANFFLDQLSAATAVDLSIPHIILPLGISFYTLQTLGYTIDVYRGKIAPERNFLVFTLFVSFFPQLVAGPIERARKLLPQLRAIPAFEVSFLVRGLLLVIWGLFLKLAVADNLNVYVTSAFEAERSGFLYLFICWLAMFRVYCDFAGYTLIARGLALGMRINLSENFRQPFLATTLTGFWQRWHITLTTWIVDYVHIPIARRFPQEPFRSLSAIGAMCLVGLWHGASWNFILFGLMHGVGMRLWAPVARLFAFVPAPDGLRRVMSWIVLSVFISLSAPLFLISDLGTFWNLVSGILTDGLGWAQILATEGRLALAFGVLAGALVFWDEVQAKRKARWTISNIAFNGTLPQVFAATVLVIFLLVAFGERGGSDFVYFQF
ncbi:MBOAT family O-acyltransferase [Pseudooceanicola sp. 200-1SW]|uniref:MBOAT family O-acyltransferase n=1 Tax=Pseudooceanicola sp. 200-1SW TaxID=3425949 RepID=UPI003D7F1C09